ncbi:MAG: NAD(P)-dependent oxidoreductase [Spirochaetaceae bacterium]|nr:NAD(P)-dependent oxidoreductase [Spirochaetaceae bacterium]
MKIAVSGATGYIGLHLINKLLNNDNQILAITRKNTEKLSSICKKYAGKISVCELVYDDLFLAVESFKPDCIYSTTCCYETDSNFLERTVDSNYSFPSALLKAAIHSGSLSGKRVRFINIGTSLPASLNLYSLTKKQFSELGEFFANLDKVQFVNVLLESFYGSDEPENRFIPRTIRKLLNNEDTDVTEGTQQRDYVSEKDAVDILSFLTAAKISESFISIPVGSGESPSIREILEYLKAITNSKSKINFGAISSRPNEPSTRADLTVLRNLGYTKELTYWKDGIKKMVEDIKKCEY